MANENETLNPVVITQNIIKYAQALNAEATLYFGTNDENLASPNRKVVLADDLRLLKVQIDVMDRLLV